MLIDSKIIKSLTFHFCNHVAVYLLCVYAEEKKDLNSVTKHYQPIRDFMVWAHEKGYSVVNQNLVNDYLSYLYSTLKFSYADVVCSYVKSFCRFLHHNGYCEFISFSGKPKPNSRKADTQSKSRLKRITDYYAVFGLDPSSSISDIRRAYHSLALQMHPDHHADDPNALKRITSLNIIFSVLKDEDARNEYDATMGFVDGETRYTKSHYIVWL